MIQYFVGKVIVGVACCHLIGAFATEGLALDEFTDQCLFVFIVANTPYCC